MGARRAIRFSDLSSSDQQQARYQRSAGAAGAPSPHAAAAAHAQPADPLAGLARMIGVEGKTIRLPGLGSFLPAREVPLIYLIVLGLMAFLFGPRAILVAAILYVVFARGTGPASGATGAPGGAGPGGPGGRRGSMPRGSHGAAPNSS